MKDLKRRNFLKYTNISGVLTYKKIRKMRMLLSYHCYILIITIDIF